MDFRMDSQITLTNPEPFLELVLEKPASPLNTRLLVHGRPWFEVSTIDRDANITNITDLRTNEVIATIIRHTFLSDKVKFPRRFGGNSVNKGDWMTEVKLGTGHKAWVVNSETGKFLWQLDSAKRLVLTPGNDTDLKLAFVKDEPPVFALMSAVEAQQARQQSNRGAGRGRSRGRGGNRGGRGGRQNAPQQAAAPEPPTEPKAEEATEDAAAEPSESGDSEVCWICAEPVKYYSVSECNHRTCHVCALRLRALYKKNDCTFCKEPQNTVIFTASPDAPYDSYPSESIPHKDPKLSIIFETQEIMEETLILLRFNCPDSACDYIGNGWGDLKLHVRATHGKLLWECFFSVDEIYPHMRERHEECFICKRNDVRDQYFLNYEQLEKHFTNAHFPCPQKECQARKFVVFNSALDLKGHMVGEHGGDMSARDRKDARRVQADFTFDDASRGGRRAGPSTPAPAPAPTPTQNRPVGSGDRRRAAFGGALTTSQTAPSPAQSTPAASRPSTPPTGAADPAVAERHALFMSRLESMASNPTTALPAARAAARGYKLSESSARDFISTMWNVLDHNLDQTASIVNSFVDLLDEEDKKQDLLASWRGFAVEQRQQFPDLIPTSVGSGYSGITSGRVLNAKNSTAARSSQQSSRQVLDRVARVASGSSTAAGPSTFRPSTSVASRAAEQFPRLANTTATSSSSSPAFRQPQRSTPWSAAATGRAAADVKGKSVTRSTAGTTSQRAPPPKLTNAAFPELPSAAASRGNRPQVGGNKSLQNILGAQSAPQASAWEAGGGGGGGASNSAEGEEGDDGEAAPVQTATTGKKKKKQKQTLFSLSAFPN
ncbi:hypothetical protein EST38_g12882 [Candolleomyces aberdarensis]|uniref:RING-type E3 ubiquitin transferase n=1 Tax=Candolleomyces aberdarensis TaxID=2316362 RepID=A0A4Q2D1C6_9AGAR|nr:hypothetical protein EST38_g12882 [Candolleomyces aberdarensis]